MKNCLNDAYTTKASISSLRSVLRNCIFFSPQFLFIFIDTPLPTDHLSIVSNRKTFRFFLYLFELNRLTGCYLQMLQKQDRNYENRLLISSMRTSSKSRKMRHDCLANRPFIASKYDISFMLRWFFFDTGDSQWLN